MDYLADLNLRSLLEHAHIGIAIHDARSSVVYANPAALRLLRLSYEQLLGKSALDPQWHFIDESNRRLHPDEFPVMKVLRFREPLRNEMLGVVDGQSDETTWFSVNAYPEFGADGAVSFVVVIFAEVNSERVRFSFRDIVENTDDMVIVTEADDIDAPNGPRIVYVNRAAEQGTGYRADELLGETPRLLQGSLTDASARQRIREHLLARKPVREKLLNYSRYGAPYWVEMNIVPLVNRFGVLTHFAAIERNISSQVFQAEQMARRNEDLRLLKDNLKQLVDRRTLELRNANQKLERLAYFDQLTQIPNRRSFIEQGAQQLARAARNRQPVLLGMLDLDHFKAINDRCGHAVGDRVLVAVAECLRSFFRQEDVFGRFGGEEFAFCMLVSESSDPLAIAERLRAVIEQCEVRDAGGAPVGVTASIGVHLLSVPAQSSAESGSPALHALLEEGLQLSDQALYRAKSEGRNRSIMTSSTPPSPMKTPPA